MRDTLGGYSDCAPPTSIEGSAITPHARRRSPGWVLACLLLLLGLMGMHAMSGGSHDMAVMAGHGSAQAGSTGIGAASSARPAIETAATAHRPLTHLPSGTVTAVTEVCLAVLTAAAVLLLRGAPRRRTTGASRPHCRPRAHLGRVLRPPDGVAGLCVSRT